MATANRTSVMGQDRGTHTPTSEAASTLQRVKDQTMDVVDNAAEMASQAKDKVQELASNVATQVKDKTQELASAATEKVEDLGKELTSMVRRYPIPALLIGFGVGLLLGRVLRA